MYKYFVLTIVFVCFLLNLSAQGLTFNSNDIPVNQRTSLQLLPGKETLKINTLLSIDFEIRINNTDQYGCIIQLDDEQNRTIYSLNLASLKREERCFRLNIEGVKNLCTLDFPIDTISYVWLPVSLCFNTKKEEVRLKIHNKSIIFNESTLQRSFSPLIFFGCHNHILDVPDFSLRKLTISIDGEIIKYPLNEKKNNQVHDSKGKIRGYVKNPRWEIEKFYNWETIYDQRISSVGGIRFDQKRQAFYIFSQDSIRTLNLASGKETVLPYDNNLDMKMNLATGFVHPVENKLCIYEVHTLSRESPSIFTLDLNTKKWDKKGYATTPIQLHHHNGFWNPRTNKYTIFGGFGNNRYSNAFYEYDPANDQWDSLHFSGDNIEPRYFAGSALDPKNNKLYLFGGMGNKYGDHTIGRSYFSDLHEIDLNKQTIRKCWKLREDFKQVSVADMVLSEDKQHIYTLAYPEYLVSSFLRLHKIDISDGTIQYLGDSIPICSEKIQTNARLYYNANRSEFYCAIFEMQGELMQAKILRLSSPVITWEEFNQEKGELPNRSWIFYTILLLAGLLILSTIIILKCQIKSVKQPESLPTDTQNTTTNCSPLQDEMPKEYINNCSKEINPTSIYPPPVYKANSIYLFGPFRVINSQGEDITNLFSQRLKQLFIYIILNSRNKGVLSSSLNELFWSDKPIDKARNIKGVTMNQLRKIISELEELDLIYEKGYYRFVFQGCYCDYWHLIDLKNSDFEEKGIENIFLSGRFLEGTDSVVLDSYKVQIEEFANLYIPQQVQKHFVKFNDRVVLRFCRILSQIDPLSEIALIYSVCSLNRINKPQEAILLYSSFINTYKQMMDEDYAYSYTTICEQKFNLLQDS